MNLLRNFKLIYVLLQYLYFKREKTLRVFQAEIKMPVESVFYVNIFICF